MDLQQVRAGRAPLAPRGPSLTWLRAPPDARARARTHAQTLVDLSRIRVLVVPVGPMAPAKFAAYLSLIRQFSAVALSDLSLSPSDAVPGTRMRARATSRGGRH